MKIFKLTLLGLLLFLIVGGIGGYFYFRSKFIPPPNQLVVLNKNRIVPFIWASDTMNGVVNPYGAMLLPVTVPGCKRTFYMQFDLGSPYSMFYNNKLKSLADSIGGLDFISREDKVFVKDFSFAIDELTIHAAEIPVISYGKKGINWANSSSIEIIGTAGADLIEGYVAVIDFPAAAFYLGDILPDSLSAKAFFTPLEFEHRRILLPVVMDGKSTSLLFDSGTSAFELLTSEKQWSDLAKKDAVVDSYGVNSWGKTLTVYSVSTDHAIKFGTLNLPIKNVHRIEGTSFVQNMLMRFSGMGGMIGNKIFIDHTIIIDTREFRFGLLTE
jgi:hypothetical protein